VRFGHSARTAGTVQKLNTCSSIGEVVSKFHQSRASAGHNSLFSLGEVIVIHREHSLSRHSSEGFSYCLSRHKLLIKAVVLIVFARLASITGYLSTNTTPSLAGLAITFLYSYSRLSPIVQDGQREVCRRDGIIGLHLSFSRSSDHATTCAIFQGHPRQLTTHQCCPWFRRVQLPLQAKGQRFPSHPREQHPGRRAEHYILVG